MHPLIILPLSACLLSSCTLSDMSSRANPVSPTVQSSTLSTTSEATETLRLAYQEELLAHDIYTKMVDKYPELIEVSNIIRSEAEHQSSVGRLLDARGITRPTDYGTYQTTYDTLLGMINTSLTGAIEVGIMVETGDIDHLLAEYKKVTDPDVRRVFENIGGASYNHLRAFLRLAKEYNYTPTTDSSKYLTEAEANQGGPLMYKMTELLQANDLPTFGNTQGMGRGGMGGGRGQGRMNH